MVRVVGVVWGWLLPADDVTSNPTGEGAPGGALAQTLINWLGQYALWASLAAMLGGAAIYGVSHRAGSYSQASTGKMLAIGGAIGAVLTGISPAAINALFHAGATG